MIHSMSGGVLADGTVYTFAKTETSEGTFWYLAPDAVEEGARVLVPLGRGTAAGTVVRVERCGKQTAPCPLNRVKEIICVL